MSIEKNSTFTIVYGSRAAGGYRHSGSLLALKEIDQSSVYGEFLDAWYRAKRWRERHLREADREPTIPEFITWLLMTEHATDDITMSFVTENATEIVCDFRAW